MKRRRAIALTATTRKPLRETTRQRMRRVCVSSRQYWADRKVSEYLPLSVVLLISATTAIVLVVATACIGVIEAYADTIRRISQGL